jgi:hypothetical protein
MNATGCSVQRPSNMYTIGTFRPHFSAGYMGTLWPNPESRREGSPEMKLRDASSFGKLVPYKRWAPLPESAMIGWPHMPSMSPAMLWARWIAGRVLYARRGHTGWTTGSRSTGNPPRATVVSGVDDAASVGEGSAKSGIGNTPGRMWRTTEQGSVQPVFIPVFPERPSDSGCFGSLQTLAYGPETSRATTGDLLQP